jgi:hypothetical protein
MALSRAPSVAKLGILLSGQVAFLPKDRCSSCAAFQSLSRHNTGCWPLRTSKSEHSFSRGCGLESAELLGWVSPETGGRGRFRMEAEEGASDDRKGRERRRRENIRRVVLKRGERLGADAGLEEPT